MKFKFIEPACDMDQAFFLSRPIIDTWIQLYSRFNMFDNIAKAATDYDLKPGQCSLKTWETDFQIYKISQNNI